MLKKVCFRCGKPSFGADDSGEWFCPICGEDLGELPSFPAEGRRFLKVLDKKPINHKKQDSGRIFDEWV
mgnify:FL=1